MRRCLVILDDLLFPTNSGGRFLAWKDSQAISEIFTEVNALVFHHAGEIPRQHEEYLSVFRNVRFAPRETFIMSSLLRPWLPFQAASRKVSQRDLEIIGGWGDHDCIVAHHEWTAEALSTIAKIFPDATRILRSHNHERKFLKSLENDAHGARKVYLTLERIRTTPAFISRSSSKAEQVWILAQDDEDAYVNSGTLVRLIPPSLDVDADEQAKGPSRDLRIGFLGALDMPQALAGLRWFVERVWPLIRADHPAATLSIAGRRADSRTTTWLSGVEGIDFLGEVPDSRQFISSLRIFVNPVFSGSGINIKMLEPAAMAIPIVSTQIGFRGLADIDGGLGYHNDVQSFADACSTLLSDFDLSRACGERSRQGVSLLDRSRVSTLMHEAIAGNSKI